MHPHDHRYGHQHKNVNKYPQKYLQIQPKTIIQQHEIINSDIIPTDDSQHRPLK